MTKRKKHKPEQIVAKLRDPDGMADEAKRLKELEVENSRLRRLLADAELDKSILKEALRGND